MHLQAGYHIKGAPHKGTVTTDNHRLPTAIQTRQGMAPHVPIYLNCMPPGGRPTLRTKSPLAARPSGRGTAQPLKLPMTLTLLPPSAAGHLKVVTTSGDSSWLLPLASITLPSTGEVECAELRCLLPGALATPVRVAASACWQCQRPNRGFGRLLAVPETPKDS